jgi:hypothetical protein
MYNNLLKIAFPSLIIINSLSFILTGHHFELYKNFQTVNNKTILREINSHYYHSMVANIVFSLFMILSISFGKILNI